MSSGIKARVLTTPAHTNMRNLLQRRIEVSQDRPSERGRSPSRDRNEKTRKSSHVSFGNKADAIEVVSVDLAMRGSNQNLPVPRLLPGRPRMTRKDQDGRTAGAQAKAGIILRSRRDLGVQGTAVPQRGTRVSLKLPKHPQRLFA